MKSKSIRILMAVVFAGVMAGYAQAAEPIKVGAFFALSGPNAPIGTPTKLVA
jgi:branched-chain amino acid transport system substrate-binding protein